MNRSPRAAATSSKTTGSTRGGEAAPETAPVNARKATSRLAEDISRGTLAAAVRACQPRLKWIACGSPFSFWPCSPSRRADPAEASATAALDLAVAQAQAGLGGPHRGRPGPLRPRALRGMAGRRDTRAAGRTAPRGASGGGERRHLRPRRRHGDTSAGQRVAPDGGARAGSGGARREAGGSGGGSGGRLPARHGVPLAEAGRIRGGLFAQALAARPLPQLHVLIGRAYRDAGEYERARTHFRSALSQDPRVRHAHYYLGMTALADEEAGPTASTWPSPSSVKSSRSLPRTRSRTTSSEWPSWMPAARRRRCARSRSGPRGMRDS